MELIASKSIGSLGRIVIPSGVRAQWGLKSGAMIDFHLNGDLLILRKSGEQCVLCKKPVAGDNGVRFDKFADEKVVFCESCYSFLWKKFKEDETRKRIQVKVEGEAIDDKQGDN